MKRFIFKSIVFLSLLTLGFTYVSNFLLPSNHYKNTIKDFNALIDEEKEIDIAIYGSSHAYCSYNPRIIDSITKTRSFNFGNDAQRLVTTKFVINETLKDIDPQVTVIDFYSATINYPSDEKMMSFQKDTYAHHAFSFNKMKYLYELHTNKYSFINELLSFNRRDFKPNFNFKDTYEYSVKANAYQYKGFTNFDLNLSKSQKKNVKHYLDNKPWVKKISLKRYDTIFKQKSIHNFKELIKILKEKNKKVVFTVAPDFGALVSKNYLSLNMYYKKLIEDSGFPLIDFNLLLDDINITENDFKDKQHLNGEGARKVSLYLGNFIKKNYNLATRENESVWIKEQPETITDYVIKHFSNELIAIDNDFNEEISIEGLSFFSQGSQKQIILRLNDKISDSILSKYKFGLHTYVNNEDKGKLMPYSKSKNRNYDAWDFKPRITEIDGNQYIIKRISTPINKFTKIRMFLYNSSGYKGIIGNNIELENIIVK